MGIINVRLNIRRTHCLIIGRFLIFYVMPEILAETFSLFFISLFNDVVFSCFTSRGNLLNYVHLTIYFNNYWE